MRTTRREFLGAAVATSLAGCLGDGPGGAGPASATAERHSPTGSGSEGVATPPAPDDALRLTSVRVGPSPGGQVPVRRSTVTLVDFFATWCAPCKPQMANLNAVRSRFGAEQLYVTSLTSEGDRAAIRAFWTEYDGNWPVLLDPDLAATQKYAVKGIPTLVLLDADGEVVWRHRGLAGGDTLTAKVREAVTA